MTVIVTKDAINLREKLSELDKETGIKGEELMRADTSAEAREALQLDQQLFTDFESTGIDDNATSTAVTVDSSGNVGIGTSSPAAFTGFTANRKTLQITHPTSGNGQLRLGTSAGFMVDHNTSGTTASTIRNLYGATNAAASLALQSGIITLGTGTSYTERMRIDSLGNASFNTTSITPSSSNVFGTAILQYGGASMSRTNSTTLDLNRSTSDGAIIQLRKDGTTVGSIGTAFTNNLFVGSSSIGLSFISGNASIYPMNPSNLTIRDGEVNLGNTGAKFNNLWLSGGAYLGGTAAANLLDDYEEGLWSPVYESVSGSFTTMTMYNNLTDKPRYTKIGNLVTVSGYIDTFDVVVGTASGDLLIDGLPFEALIAASGSVSVTGLWAGDNPLSVSVGYQSTSLRIQYRTSVNGDDIDMNVSDLTTGTGLASNTNGMAFTITYTTSA